jgi:hypothetical protein
MGVNYMLNKENKGVCCDVTCCIHNRRGCDCALEKIKVTTGETEHMHFCKSFAPEEKK